MGVAERDGVVYLGDEALTPEQASIRAVVMNGEANDAMVWAVPALDEAKAALAAADAALAHIALQSDTAQQLLIAAKQARQRLGLE